MKGVNRYSIFDMKKHQYFLGDICPIILRNSNEWQATKSLIEVLQAVVHLIDNPDLNDPLRTG